MRFFAAAPQVDVPASKSRGSVAWHADVWLAASLVFLLSILVRLADLGQLARFDELYTLLSARGWLSDGVPHIADGIYDRAEAYTVFIGWWLALFGDNLIVARLPSVLFGSLLAVAVFLWTNAVAGRAAAWIAGLFVAFASISVEMSQYARFYTSHALAFWFGAIGLYALGTGQLVGTFARIAVAAGTALSLLCALYLQILTLMGAVGLGIWLSGVVLLSERLRPHYRSKRFCGLLGAGVLVASLLAVVVLTSDPGEMFLQQYLRTPLHLIHHEDQFYFYHLHMIERYPTLWPVFPFLALIAVAARPQPSIFAICVFSAVLAIISFGGMKGWRYLFFALPFLFVVWAIALASLWPALRDAVTTAMASALPPVNPGLKRILSWSLIVGSCVFLILSNGSSARTLLRPLGIHLGEGFSANWPGALPILEPLVDEADVVLTSHELHMLYYLGRADIVVSKERLAEFSETEFARDQRTGLPVVSRPESVARIVDCFASGVLVTDTIKGWQAPTVIDADLSHLIERRMTPIALPARSKLRAFEWQTESPDRFACARIPSYEAP